MAYSRTSEMEERQKALARERKRKPYSSIEREDRAAKRRDKESVEARR